MNNEMMYKMFLSTLSRMSDQDLQNALVKAKGMLSENDYNNLLILIEKERNKKSE
ncbi:MAG: hypothetical protein IJX25_02750 [Clostridia bacterium]|nr:hypothetical protein [Clostridia bacterium]